MVKKIDVGSFGRKQLITELLYKPETTDLVLFFHGCCSSPFGLEKTNTQLISEYLIEDKKTAISCGFFESSRIERAVEVQHVDFFAFNKVAFKGKTFTQEENDVRVAIDALLSDFKNKQNTLPRIHFVGFSLGGLLSILVSDTFNPDTITTFGSAITFNTEEDTPIIGGNLEQSIQKRILEAAGTYEGVITMVRGSEDSTATQGKALELFHGFDVAQSRSFVEWRGVDHRFRSRFSQLDAVLPVTMANLIMNSVTQKPTR